MNVIIIYHGSFKFRIKHSIKFFSLCHNSHNVICNSNQHKTKQYSGKPTVEITNTQI